jgi:hypothetical protein
MHYGQFLIQYKLRPYMKLLLRVPGLFLASPDFYQSFVVCSFVNELMAQYSYDLHQWLESQSGTEKQDTVNVALI